MDHFLNIRMLIMLRSNIIIRINLKMNLLNLRTLLRKMSKLEGSMTIDNTLIISKITRCMSLCRKRQFKQLIKISLCMSHRKKKSIISHQKIKKNKKHHQFLNILTIKHIQKLPFHKISIYCSQSRSTARIRKLHKRLPNPISNRFYMW